jgi:hypothetical protein
MTTPVVEQTRRGTSRKRPADFTGRQGEQLQESKKAEIIEASQRIALVNAEMEQAKDEVVDYTGSSDPLPSVQLQSAEVNTPFRMIRVNSDIEQMTYGRNVIDPGDLEANPPRAPRMGSMNMYTFREGQLYRVPKEIAEHLQTLGYIAYMGGA